MNRSHHNRQDPDQPAVYQIRLRGVLGEEWTGWFDGMHIETNSEGDTLITGTVADQAALYGLLRKTRDLGLPLRSIHEIRSSKFPKF